MKNWTVREAAKVIRENKDTDAIKEIVKHFPLFAMIVASADFDAFAAAMPEHVTVRKIENELNSGSADAEEGTEEPEEDESADQNLNDMSTKQLIALCGKRGIKVPKYGKNKQFYLDALAGGSTDEAVDEDEDEEEEDDPVALYKKCKKAGLKVAPKKSAKYYKDALKKAEDAASDDSDDTDDWDEDADDEDEKPAKKATKGKAEKKSSAKSTKKAVKAEEPEESDEEDDDEDDWDI